MSGIYEDYVIEEVRSRNDIVDVISEYISLKRKGQYFFGICPFHNEKSPSFSVTPSKQIFYCYGCQKGGSVFHFIMSAENLDFLESLKYLADRVNYQLPEKGTMEDQKLNIIKQELLKINKESAKYFHEQLFESKNFYAKSYIENRGINESTIKKFGLGFSNSNSKDLYDFLKNKGYSDEILIKTGLILKNNVGSFYDRFRNRIMFPIFDIRGNVIAFGGRVIDDNLPKYMNSPETLVYSKGKNLYAMNFVKNVRKKSILVVEGYLDVISLFQNGINNVVASLGTALTEGQGRLLKKYAEEIIISYDSDSAGKAATLRGLDVLDKLGSNVKVLEIPKSKDPDEFIRNNGALEFEKLINKSLTLVEYKLKIVKSDVDFESTQGKVDFIQKSAEVLANLNNDVQREIYAKKLSREYGISEESVFSEITKRSKKNDSNFKQILNKPFDLKPINIDKNINENSVHEERFILCLLSQDNRLYQIIKDRFIDYFEDNDNIAIAKALEDKLRLNKELVLGEFLCLVEFNLVDEFSRIITKECNFEDYDKSLKALNDCRQRIASNRCERRKKEILDALKNKESLPEGDVLKLTQELNLILLKKVNGLDYIKRGGVTDEG